MSELEDIKKQLEGNTLAMGAVAEVLQKMDERLSKAEEEDEKEKEAAMEKAFQDDLVKAVTTAVISNISKADPENKLGLDVDGGEGRPAKPTAPGPQDTDKPANPTTDIEEQQNYIQASADSLAKAEEDDDDPEKMKMKAMHDDDDDKAEKMKMKAMHDDDDDAEKMKDKAMHKADEDDDPEKMKMKAEDDDDEKMESMKKEIESLKKQLETSVATEAESRLRKMGFREENGLQRPQVFTPDTPATPLGTDGSTPIVKSGSPDDTVDQLSSLSYKQLRDIQTKIESGDTDGVPRELLG